MTIILCDMGGTHVRLAHADLGHDASKSEILNPQKFKIADYPSFDAALDDYLNKVGIKGAEVAELRMALGNRNPWRDLAAAVRLICPTAQYSEINDFAANSLGIAMAPDCKLRVVRAGNAGDIPPHAARAVIGPGTGTGLAYILTTPYGPHVQGTHGAHIPPTYPTREHQDLFAAIHKLRALSPRIIVEDILCGPGLWALYTHLRAQSGLYGEDPPPYLDTKDMILSGAQDKIATDSLRLFHEIFGAFAAQVVAYGFAYGGLYLTGGITDTIMESGRFDLPSFLKFYDLNLVDIVKTHIAATPIYWVDDPYIALKGLLFKNHNVI